MHKDQIKKLREKIENIAPGIEDEEVDETVALALLCSGEKRTKRRRDQASRVPESFRQGRYKAFRDAQVEAAAARARQDPEFAAFVNDPDRVRYRTHWAEQRPGESNEEFFGRHADHSRELMEAHRTGQAWVTPLVKVAHVLAKRYGWSLVGAAEFLLNAGWHAPHRELLKITYDSKRDRIWLIVDPSTPPEEVARLYRAEQGRIVKRSTTNIPRLRDAILALHVIEMQSHALRIALVIDRECVAPPVRWQVIFSFWNNWLCIGDPNLPKAWVYKDFSAFHRAATRALRQVDATTPKTKVNTGQPPETLTSKRAR